MNPILPIDIFVPDAEARQWTDGRMYIYGSYDLSGDTTYCSYKYHVYSSSDLINWTDHGVSFSSAGENGDVPWSKEVLYAPDCIYKDGKYYMYFCMSGNSEGVAVSSLPQGPFKDSVKVDIADGDSIDPAIFIDDDGKIYYYWGQFSLCAGMLMDDMHTIIPETINRDLINEKDHGFHEGASVRKHKGLYYLVYTDISRGKATCFGYATSKSPLGPFTKRGIIIDNDGCDNKSWNNHGSIAEFNGKWYVFYHRSSQSSCFSRRVCVEPITFLEDGTIPEVEMTTQGVTGPISVISNMEASRACLLSGEIRTAQLKINGITTEYLTLIENNSWACYKYFDFSKDVTSFVAYAGSQGIGGTIEIRLDTHDGKLIGSCEISHTGGWLDWQKFSGRITDKISGVHTVYLVFKGKAGRLFDLLSFNWET